MQSIFGGWELLTSDLTFCMKSRECNNTPSQQNICCSLSIPSFVFIYYYFICVSREILMKGTKKPRTFVFIYVCGVCVSVYVWVLYIWVCDRFCMALVAGCWCYPVAAFWVLYILVCTVAGTVSEVSSVTYNMILYVLSSIHLCLSTLSSLHPLNLAGCCGRMW